MKVPRNSHRASVAMSCRRRPCTHKKPPVLNAVSTGITRPQLPGSGEIPSLYALLGSVDTADSTPEIISPQLRWLSPARRRLTPLLDIGAVRVYCENIAPDPAAAPRKYEGQHRTGVFLFEPRRLGVVAQ